MSNKYSSDKGMQNLFEGFRRSLNEEALPDPEIPLVPAGEKMHAPTGAQKESYKTIMSLLRRAGLDDVHHRPHPKFPKVDVLIGPSGRALAEISPDGKVSFHDTMYDGMRELYNQAKDAIEQLGYQTATSVDDINFDKHGKGMQMNERVY